jgi:hypothetical protein
MMAPDDLGQDFVVVYYDNYLMVTGCENEARAFEKRDGDVRCRRSDSSRNIASPSAIGPDVADLMPPNASFGT